MNFQCEWRRSDSKRRYDFVEWRYKANDILTRKVMPLPVASSSKVRMEASSVSELSSYESMGSVLLHWNTKVDKECSHEIASQASVLNNCEAFSWLKNNKIIRLVIKLVNSMGTWWAPPRLGAYKRTSSGRSIQTQVTYTPSLPRPTSRTSTMCGYYGNYYGGRGYGCCGCGGLGYGYGGLGYG